ncbi:MAG: trypsin-like peptidase domain-containing protein [Thiocapsa sp.]|nr:trypsin-like peptidase domain-containing protein [Thiocapsa sp.]MCG6896404.1 trypsin-like peptidase domain-containing protein [Thiocapsa sp.]MCG6983955.1 trypsin-like peptidase domain-containing protein [Thiocapsa sp.]
MTALVGGASGAISTLWLSGGAATPADSGQSLHTRRGDLPTFAEAIARVAPAVVSIFATQTDPQLRRTAPHTDSGPVWMTPPGSVASRTGLGSGVILAPDGLILTNRHVVHDADRVRAVLADGRSFQVVVLGVDPDTDLAVLKADAEGLPTAPIGRSQALRVGDLALAIGNPFGIGQTVTMGIVSATGRGELGITSIENFIQTDAAINPGNSGGALINAQGELVGINTAILTESGASQGVGFAIPGELAIEVARSLATHGQVSRGWIGLHGRSVNPGVAESFGLRTMRGVLVASTLVDSPAARAGLRPGDVVTRVDNRDVTSVQDLLEAIAGAGPNAQIDLEVWRGSQRMLTRATTETRPPVAD